MGVLLSVSCPQLQLALPSSSCRTSENSDSFLEELHSANECRVCGTCPEKLAGATGLEPAASCVTGRRSNQLNYVPTRQINKMRKNQCLCGLARLAYFALLVRDNLKRS
jgi:hypothetical protein